MSPIEIVLGLATLALTVFGGYMALKLKPYDDAMDGLDRRLNALHDDAKEARQDLDRRVADIERSYLSRAELTAAIKDLRDGMDKGYDRVEQIVRALGGKVDHLADRVGKVEGQG